MAESGSSYSYDIQSEELADLLKRAVVSGHPEWDYQIRAALVGEKITEAKAIKQLKDWFDPPKQTAAEAKKEAAAEAKEEKSAE